MTDKADWVSAESPPSGSTGLWTQDVVAVTNFGKVYKISYFHGKDGGVWQRPAIFEDGEQVEWWAYLPIN